MISINIESFYQNCIRMKIGKFWNSIEVEDFDHNLMIT